MKFDHDAGKAQSNLDKHGVKFEEAESVLLDPDLVEWFDDGHSADEDRFVVVGRSNRLRLLFVVYVERYEDTIRIITARRATRREQERYAKGGR